MARTVKDGRSDSAQDAQDGEEETSDPDRAGRRMRREGAPDGDGRYSDRARRHACACEDAAYARDAARRRRQAGQAAGRAPCYTARNSAAVAERTAKGTRRGEATDSERNLPIAERVGGNASARSHAERTVAAELRARRAGGGK